MNTKPVCVLLIAILLALSTSSVSAFAQTPTPYPMPAPNVLLLYTHDVLTLINTAPTPLSLAAFSFMRAGGVVKYSVPSLASSLAPGHCLQWWTAKVNKTPDKPAECAARDGYARLSRDNTYFWVAGYDSEPFRPQLYNSALAICNASAGRCTFNLPQGDDAKKPWVVLDPATGLPMPAGIQVAYDNNQIWIGNLTPNTVLPTAALRLIYTANNEGIVWSPGKYDQWDVGPWNNRPLLPGQCIVLYADPAKVTPLLPCTPIARTVRPEHPWTLKFDVMGPREEQRANCGSDKPMPGPVLCLVSG